MEAKTVDLKYNIGRTIPIRCVENDPLRDLQIKDNCFLLLIVHEGSVRLQCGEEVIDAMGPCLLCFDERCQKVFLSLLLFLVDISDKT